MEAETVRRRILFEEAPDGVLVIDPETASFLEFNTAAHTQLGYTREEFANLHIYDVEAKETAEETQSHIRAVVREGRSDFETLQRTKQGELRNVHVTAMLVDVLGKPVYYCIWRDITERKWAEEARRESDELYHLLFREMTQGVVIQNNKGAVVHANPAAQKIMGLTMERMQGRTAVSPDYPMFREDGSVLPVQEYPISIVLNTGNPVYNRVLGVFNPNFNSTVWLNINALPRFMGGEHKPYQVFTIFEDVTERRHAEQLLRESEKRLRSLLEISMAVSGPLEMNTILQKIVVTATELLKLDSGAIYTLKGGEELYLEATTPPLPPDMPDEFRKANLADHPHIQSAIASGAPVILPDSTQEELTPAEKVVVEGRGLRSVAYIPLVISEKAIGALIVASVNKLRVFEDEEIALYSGFSGQAAQTIENIRLYEAEQKYTARLEAEIAERRQAEERLRDSEERFQQIANNVGEVVWMFDNHEQMLVYLNAAYEKIWGRSIEETYQNTQHYIDAIHPEDRGAMFAALERQGRGERTEMEYRVVQPNGSIHWISDRSFPIYGEDGTLIRTTGIATDITARRQAEDDLRESERKYRELINGMNDTVWVIDTDMRLLDVNDAAVKKLGYSRDELLSMKVSDVDSAIEPEEIQKLIDRLGEEKIQIFETRHKTKDGREIPIEVSSSLISYMGRTVIMSIARDITDRKRAEQEAHLAEQRYRALIEYAPDGVVLIDVNGRFKYASPSVERIFGYAQEDLPLCNSVEMTHPEDLPAVLPELAKLLEQPSYIPTLQYRFRHKNGEWRWIESTFSNLITTPGLEAIIINFRDIQERKLAEDELRLAEHRYRALIENAPDGIALLGPDNKFNYLSPSAQKIMGYDQLEIRLQEPDALTHPDDLPMVIDELKKVIQDPLYKPTVQYRFMNKSGEWRWVESTFSNLSAFPGVEAIILNFRDITERRQTEDALQKSQELLKEAQRIARVGHMEWSGIDEGLVCSDEVYDIFNLPHGAPLSRKVIMQMMHPGEQERIHALDLAAFRQRADMDYEYSIRTLDGDTRWLHQMNKVTYDENETPARMLAIVQDITERKKTEHILSESRTRLEMALEGAKAGMWDWNVQSGETVFNERWAEIVGYSLAELGPVNINTWVDLCHPDDLKRSDELLKKHFSGETEFYTCEARMRHKNGAWVWVLDQGRVMEWDEGGKPVRMFGTHIDITGQKREELYTQAVLRLTNLSYESSEMEDLMRAMLDEAEELTDSQVGFFHFVDEDQNTIKLQAWSTNTLTNMCTAEGKGQHYPVAQAGVWADAIRKGEACIYNDYASAPDRKGMPAGHAPVQRLISLPVKRNNLVVAALGVGNKPQDYTEQDLDVLSRLSEAVFDMILRKRAEEALRNNEYRFRTVADFTYDMEFWLDENQNLLYVSPSCKRITGYEREQFLKEPALLGKIVHPEDRSIFDGHNKEEFTLAESCSLDFRIIDAGGSVRWINHTCQAVTGEGGSFRGRRVSHRDVTDQKQILKELRTSEEKYRVLLESLDSVVANIDLNGRFLYMNDTAATMLGGTPEQLIGRTINELFPAQAAEIQIRDIQIVAKADQGMTFENMIHVRGQPRWHRTSIQPLHEENGKVVSALINSTDIHELKTMQQELQELNRNLEQRVKERTAQVQDLYDNAPAGYHSLDANGRIISINETEARWLGYTPGELIGQPVLEMLAPVSRQAFQKAFSDFMQNGTISNFEIEAIRKDGSTFPVMISAAAVYDENGQYLSSRSSMIDITERKQAENELKRNANFTRALLNAVPTPVFYKDREGRYLGCNHAFVDLMGKTSGEIQGKLPHEIWDADHADVYRQKDIDLMQANERQVYESLVKDKDGNVRPVIFVKDVFFDEGGNVAGLVGAFIDITERKKAEETLRHANSELARALRTKDEFLANISHELRTPLNGILGFTEMLLSGEFGELDDRQMKYLGSIDSSGRHLLGLINDLLDLAKIEAGKLTITPERVVLTDLCQASLIFVKQAALKKGIHVEFENEVATPFIVADQRRLKQILVNLLSNAVKFTPENGSVNLKASFDPDRQSVLFSVRDTGIGISTEDIQKLFKPFTQVDSSLTRSHEGTGLGLALVRELVEMHGGSIRVESELGVGSTFIVSIPQTQPVMVEPGNGTEDMITNREGEDNTQPFVGKILLAEDMESNIMIVRDYLEMQGFEVVIARNGREAVAVCKEASPDLILMDIQMPEMDGLEATRQLRADPRFASVPIIALTALAMTGDRERCLEAGATEYLSKPMNLKKLNEMIRSLLGGKRQ